MCVLPVPLLPSSRIFSLRARNSRARQLQHQRLVQRGDGEEVEAVQALDYREPGLPDAPLGGAAVAVEQFQFGESQQVSAESRVFSWAH